MRSKTKSIVLTGVMAAVICVISLLQLPTATGVPLTFQVFAVSLSGYVLGGLFGTAAVLIYVTVGLVGIPVFSGYMGGFSVLFGPTGGFVAGFFILAFLAGIGKGKKTPSSLIFGFFGLVLCHTVGILHYASVMDCGITASFITVSLPYVIKDCALMIGAYFLSLPIKRSISKK